MKVDPEDEEGVYDEEYEDEEDRDLSLFEAMGANTLNDSSSSVWSCQSETNPAAEQWIDLALRIAA